MQLRDITPSTGLGAVIVYNGYMLTLEQMLVRVAVAMALGAILGLEREIVHKETGIRTEMLVAVGAAIFTMVGIMLPYLATAPLGTLPTALEATNSFSVIANIIVGIGFLGAGLIVKDGIHTHNLTTAALVWTTAGIGILAGLGLFEFATIVTVALAIILYVFRRLSFAHDGKSAPIPRRIKKS